MIDPTESVLFVGYAGGVILPHTLMEDSNMVHKAFALVGSNSCLDSEKPVMIHGRPSISHYEKSRYTLGEVILSSSSFVKYFVKVYFLPATRTSCQKGAGRISTCR